MNFTYDEISMLMESLRYTKKSISECEYYPSYEFKLERLKEVDGVMEKLKELKSNLKGEKDGHSTK